jgi:hypothetical protein
VKLQGSVGRLVFPPFTGKLTLGLLTEDSAEPEDSAYERQPVVSNAFDIEDVVFQSSYGEVWPKVDRVVAFEDGRVVGIVALELPVTLRESDVELVLRPKLSEY